MNKLRRGYMTYAGIIDDLKEYIEMQGGRIMPNIW